LPVRRLLVDRLSRLLIGDADPALLRLALVPRAVDQEAERRRIPTPRLPPVRDLVVADRPAEPRRGDRHRDRELRHPPHDCPI
jgi:hypothetical protein